MMSKCHFRVNCVIGGAQKSGTTALASFLSQHKDICLPPQKEVHFFDDHKDSKYSDCLPKNMVDKCYQLSYPNYCGEKVVIDATPIYMYHQEVPQRIFNYNPEMKWIIVLRDPAHRALSHYLMERSMGNEHLSVLRAFARERKRIVPNREDHHHGMRRFSYLDRGFYSYQLTEVLKYFPADQILVLSSEDLWMHHNSTLKMIYSFLELRTPLIIPMQKRVFSNSKKITSFLWLIPFLKLYYALEFFRLRALLKEIRGQ